MSNYGILISGLAWAVSSAVVLPNLDSMLTTGVAAKDQAEHFGDIMSAEVNLGASVSRADYTGIVALAQGYGV